MVFKCVSQRSGRSLVEKDSHGGELPYTLQLGFNQASLCMLQNCIDLIARYPRKPLQKFLDARSAF